MPQRRDLRLNPSEIAHQKMVVALDDVNNRAPTKCAFNTAAKNRRRALSWLAPLLLLACMSGMRAQAFRRVISLFRIQIANLSNVTDF